MIHEPKYCRRCGTEMIKEEYCGDVVFNEMTGEKRMESTIRLRCPKAGIFNEITNRHDDRTFTESGFEIL